MGLFGRLLAMMVFFVPTFLAYAQYANTPHDLNEAAFWLEAKAQQLVRGARVIMPDGTPGFEPAASGFYPCFWMRDYAYMLEGCPEAFTNAELESACYTLVNAVRGDGYAVECIDVGNGRKYYHPWYDTPDTAFSGVHPTADNSQFTTDIVWRTYQITKDASLLAKVCRSNNRTIIDNLVTEMKMVPRSGGMVYIGTSAAARDRCGYGFTDSVKKTGNELYCSLLDVRAGNELADLLTLVGRQSEAAAWRAAAAAETGAIQKTFWNARHGTFHAATGRCNQIDVWGSAFAVELGVATPAQAASIANYFNNNYAAMVFAGQIREIPTPHYWQDSVCAPGTGVNGGYWGVAAGQFANALKRANPTLSKQTLLDLVNFYKAKNDVPEYTNPGGKVGGAASDCAGAALPLVQFKRYMLSPEPVLQSMKGILNAVTDVALAANGGTPFAENSHDSSHAAAHLNDGAYGDGNGWIANSQSSFAGVAFDRPCTISALAFGRDNTGACADRYQGTYIFQYATKPSPNAGTPDADWTSFGAFCFDAAFPNVTNQYRHEYTFSPIRGVTGVRIEVSANSSGAANYMGIDELEVVRPVLPKQSSASAPGVSGSGGSEGRVGEEPAQRVMS